MLREAFSSRLKRAALPGLLLAALAGRLLPMGGSLPGGLPGSFAFGSQSFPSGAGSRAWMDATKSGNNAQWSYRYTYFNAGVNTGWGWSTWNAPAGQYASLYMSDSDAGGYIPVLIYYQMLQSNPATGADESAKDYNNLNNSSTMYAYFDDFKLLLQKAGAFNKPVIIHVEPDLFGYVEKDHTSGTNNPVNCSAAVASSGHADAAGLPNNFQGYCQALRRMRDTYAPKAKLAMHVSMWASGQDLMASSLLTQANIDAEIADTSTFLNACDAGAMGKFDLFFFEFSDRDASYKYSTGLSWYWWDTAASNIGGSPITFARQLYVLDKLSASLGKRGMGWQVPVGNTTYKTCNNASLHWRSPYAEYILGGYNGSAGASHIKDYANSGVIGMLFGAGMSDQTHPWDEAGDGVSNGSNVSNYGSVQGSTLATVSDDDGGYLRTNVGNYFTKGTLPLSGAPTATPTLTRTPPVSPTPTATPTPDCPRALNLAESFTENGVWGGINAGRTLNTSVPEAISQGSASLKAQVNFTNAWWNAEIFILNGFSPNVLQPYNAISFDLYADPAALPWSAGATSTKLAVIGNCNACSKWAQAITADADLVPGMNHLSLPLDFTLGTLLPTDILSSLQFVLKVDLPSTGILYLDNIVLHTGGACAPTATPTATRSATPSASPTPSASATRSPTATPSPTPSGTLSSSPSATISASPTATPSPTPSASRTASSSATVTVTFTRTATATESPSATLSYSASPSPAGTLTHTPTLTLSPTLSPSPSATASATLTATPSGTPTASGTATLSASPSSTATQTLSNSPTFSPVPTGSSPTVTPSETAVVTGTPTQTQAATASETLSPSETASPAPSASLTVTFSPTASASPVLPGTPTFTPSPTPTSTAQASASAAVESKLLEAVALPNPAPSGGPLVFALKVQGQPQWVELGLYTPAMVRVDSRRLDLAPSAQRESWLRLPALQAPLASGLYYARFSLPGSEAYCKVFVTR